MGEGRARTTWALIGGLAVLVGLGRLAPLLGGPGIGALALDLLSLGLTCAAVLQFSRGDEPRLPWSVRATALALVVVARSLSLTSHESAYLGIVIVANVVGAVALILFARLALRHPLREPLSARGQVLLWSLAVAGIGLAGLVVPTALGELDQLRGWALLVSTLADGVVFIGGAVTLVATLAIGRGPATWPLLALAGDGLTHLLLDVAAAFEITGEPIQLLGALAWAFGAGAAASVLWVAWRT